jgi:hypothetical protein
MQFGDKKIALVRKGTKDKPVAVPPVTAYQHMHPLVTVEHRQRLLRFGLQFGSDFRSTATFTGLTPAPARFGVCLCPTLFVITFKVLIRYGDIIQNLRLFVKGGCAPFFTNLFPVFSPVFVYLAHPFVRL